LVRLLGHDVPTLYPAGESWLYRRTDELRQRQAQAYVALVGSRLTGAAICVNKGRDRVKLSTLFVHDGYRHLGIGHMLMDACINAWVDSRIAKVHVTVNSTLESSVGRFFMHVGFDHVATERSRYRCDQDELVYEGATKRLWHASQSWHSSPCLQKQSTHAPRHTSTAAPRLPSLPAIKSSYTRRAHGAW
jgi:N-acetylglutamate synthase-like GNAT family acetyltransferase